MKLIEKIFSGIRHHAMMSLPVAALLLAGCASDNIEEPTPTPDNETPAVESYYLTLNIKTPSDAGTRAGGKDTDENGGSGETLQGTSAETTLTSAHIYFCLNNDIKADFEADYVSEMNGSATSMRVEISDEGLEKLSSLVGETVQTAQVFVVGNTKNNGEAFFSPSIGSSGDISLKTFSVSSATDDLIGDFGESGHLMPLVNAEKFEITIPEKGTSQPLDIIKGMFNRFTPTIAWWDLESTKNTDKTTLNLERAVARFEYKDIDRDGFPEYPSQTNIELEGRKTGTEIDYSYFIGNLDVVAVLDQIQPFNVNKTAYVFRNVSVGTYSAWASSSLELLGVERGNVDNQYNWVVSPWWLKSPQTPSFANKLNITQTEYQIEGTAGAGKKYISELIGRTNGSNPADGYMPFCYVTENTIPEIRLMADVDTENNPSLTKYATGVMFYLKVLDKKGKPIDKETTEDLPAEVTRSTETGKTDYIVITDPATGKWVELAPSKDKDNNDCYYLKYIACIVHNDGKKGTGATFAPMYYGVVRNNTYQIRVSKVDGLPLPQDPKTLFLQVDINVLDWTVRDNEFVL